MVLSILEYLAKKTIKSEFSYIELWFTDQNLKPIETEDRKNIPFNKIN